MTISALSDLGLAQRDTRSQKANLGQEDFLKLMTTQLTHQDPFKPMESGEFLGQIAQFSTVSGIQSLNNSFAGLSGSLSSAQALQASGLVGHGVLVPSTEAYLQDGNEVEGAVELNASGQVQVLVTDASGAVVRHIDLGLQPAGLAPFTWDGRDDAGRALEEGHYALSAQLDTGSGAVQSAGTLVSGIVNSVSLGSSGLTLNLLGMDPAAFSSVRQIQ